VRRHASQRGDFSFDVDLCHGKPLWFEGGFDRR
jgi:hypothetical protein